MHYARLDSRRILALSGDDTIPFLQGLISNDAAQLVQGKLVYSALLSPQGKFLHDFFLVKLGEKILLDCDETRIDDLVKRLQLYKLRSKVDIAKLPEFIGVAVVWGETLSPAQGNHDVIVFDDPRHPKLGQRILGDAVSILEWCGAQGWEQGDEAAYNRMRLSLGVPDGVRDMIVDKSLLLDFGFDQLHGVDFNKGCYVGQEVTARMRYRGQTKKALYQVRADGELPAPGTLVTAGEEEIGQLRSHAGNIGLALLRNEELQKAQQEKRELRAGDRTLEIFVPDWAAGESKNIEAQ